MSLLGSLQNSQPPNGYKNLMTGGYDSQGNCVSRGYGGSYGGGYDTHNSYGSLHNNSYSAHSIAKNIANGGVGDYMSRGWDSYSGKFYDNNGREVSVTIEGQVRKGSKVTLKYYVSDGEATGYIIQTNGQGWTVQGTYADELSTGKFYLSFDPATGNISGSRTPYSEVGCGVIPFGCSVVPESWILAPTCRRGDRQCATMDGCSVM